jgi:hypothetical protein
VRAAAGEPGDGEPGPAESVGDHLHVGGHAPGPPGGTAVSRPVRHGDPKAGLLDGGYHIWALPPFWKCQPARPRTGHLPGRNSSSAARDRRRPSVRGCRGGVHVWPFISAPIQRRSRPGGDCGLGLTGCDRAGECAQAPAVLAWLRSVVV